MAENISEVVLLKVSGLKNDYKHTFYFGDVNSQKSYFNGLSDRKTITDFSYVRKDSKLRVNLSLDEAMKYNYVQYVNVGYNNKLFYAFITEYEWKNDSVTELTLETDVIQTWLPFTNENAEIRPSFVEREHTIDDTIGANTVAENLETGEYIVKSADQIKLFSYLYVIVGVTATPEGTTFEGAVYNGCFTGVKYYCFHITTNQGLQELRDFIKSYDESDEVDNNAVVTMFLAPYELSEPITTEGSTKHTVSLTDTPYNTTFLIPVNNSFNGYTPRNKKLFTSPYNYLLASNNNGGSAIYQYEHFSKEEIAFAVYGVLTPGCSIRMIPMNYKGSLVNDEEGLNLGKFPICSWPSDEYTNWLTQNSVNIGVNLVQGAMQVIAGGATALMTAGTGAVLGGGMAMSGISSITNQLVQIHQQSFTPPQANGNINSGDVITATGKNTFTFYQMCIKPEYMKIIDEYFDMFGYKTNRVKVPNKDHRENWWYTKTIDINITSVKIPSSDLEKIKSIYNNGITFWRTKYLIGSYDKSNDITV